MPAFVDSSYQYTIAFNNEETGAAIDVSAYAFGMEWYRAGESDPAVTLTQGSGIDVTSAASGSITVSLTPAQTVTLGRGMVRIVLYQDYANDSTRKVIAEGSEAIEGVSYDA